MLFRTLNINGLTEFISLSDKNTQFQFVIEALAGAK